MSTLLKTTCLTWAPSSFSPRLGLWLRFCRSCMKTYPKKLRKRRCSWLCRSTSNHAAAVNLFAVRLSTTKKTGEVDTTGRRQARKRVLDIGVTCGRHGVSPWGMGLQTDQNVTPASAFPTVGHSKSLRMDSSKNHLVFKQSVPEF